jgi:hypothetical protein
VKKGSAFLLAGAFLFAGATFAGTSASTAAARPATAVTNHTVTGTVAAVDAAGKSFKVKGAKGAVAFVSDAAIQVTRTGGEASWSDLKVGDKVSVTYHMKGTSRIATKVSIQG